MTKFQIRPSAMLGDSLFRLRLRWRSRFGRAIRGARYAAGRMSPDDAQRIMCDCERSAGWFPLLTLTVDDTLDLALEEYAEHPELPSLIRDACSSVAGRWESYNDDLYNAQSWALEKVREYAVSDGIVLLPAANVIQEQPDGLPSPKGA